MLEELHPDYLEISADPQPCNSSGSLGRSVKETSKGNSPKHRPERMAASPPCENQVVFRHSKPWIPTLSVAANLEKLTGCPDRIWRIADGEYFNLFGNAISKDIGVVVHLTERRITNNGAGSSDIHDVCPESTWIK